jgi:PAS domain S-box-containing protein
MKKRSTDELVAEIEHLQSQLMEAQDTIDAIRNGQIDALVLNGEDGHTLYTLKSADVAYRVFIEQMSEGALTLNAEGMILYSNSKFAELTGEKLSSIIGRTFSDFVNVPDREEYQALFERGWQENTKGEINVVSGEALIPVQISLNVLLLDSEMALSLIVTDLTRQKENALELKSKNEQLLALNEALINSNHDLQQFASVASHDLQEPLRKIQVFSKFLKDRNFKELSDDARQCVEKIINSSQRMKVLIVDILTYSRLSADKGAPEQVDMGLLTREILDDLDLKIIERQAKVEVGELCIVEGNKGQLRQVFNNLISNALKFTNKNENPSIAITMKPLHAEELGLSLDNPESYCRVSVKDNGIGFDERFASSIFSLFEKLNPKNSYEGSGIGLAIAKRIVEKHHGLIIAKSAPGQGAEFNVILPYHQFDGE